MSLKKSKYENESRNDRIAKIIICTVFYAAFASQLVMMTKVRYTAAFSLTLPLLFAFLIFTKIKSRKAFMVISAAAAAGLFVTAFVFHSEIIEGMKIMLNSLFSESERTQAYLYEKYKIDADPGTYIFCMRCAAAWTGAVAGYILSFVPERFFLLECAVLMALIMIGFAYFGIIPDMIPAGMMTVCLLFVLPQGSIKSALPVIVCVILVFTLVTAVSPGEKKAVSKIDEQIRDRLAVSTVSIQGHKNITSEKEKKDKEKKENGGSKSSHAASLKIKNKKFWIVAGLILLTLMILFVPAVIHDHLEKKRRKNRKGLDSKDPKEAVCAMLPYVVKWLEAGGLRKENETFSSLTSKISEMESFSYTERYAEMVDLWKKAAYSDHVIGGEDRSKMKEFMDETMNMVRERLRLSDKIKVRFVTAL